MAKPIEINDLLIYLADAYPGQARGSKSLLTEDVLRVYEEMLADLPTDVLWLAAYRYMRGGNEYFPSVSQLCRQASSSLYMASFAECTWLRRQAEKYNFEITTVTLTDELFEH